MYRVISVDFRRYPFLVLINLNMLKQVPNPLLGLALALALILASIKQLRDSHLRWFITSVDGYPFFLFLYNGHFNLVKMS